MSFWVSVGGVTFADTAVCEERWRWGRKWRNEKEEGVRVEGSSA